MCTKVAVVVGSCCGGHRVHGELSGEVRMGTGWTGRHRGRRAGLSLDGGANMHRGFAAELAKARLGEREETNSQQCEVGAVSCGHIGMDRGPHLHSQPSRRFTGRRKERVQHAASTSVCQAKP